MASLLDKLKENSKTMYEKTTEALTTTGKRESEFYFPEIDKNTNKASVRIRFLPSADPEDVPYVFFYNHFIKGDDGRWLIMDVCPTSINEPCPICELNSKLWKTEIKAVQDEVRKRSRKKHYVCNILVLNDPTHPEKNGKVFPYQFGAAIFNKLSDAIKPEFDSPAFNPFDLWEGADFDLRIFRDPNKGNQVSYEKSSFASPSPLYDGDEEKLNEVVEQLVDLKKYLDPETIKNKNRRVTPEKIYSGYEKLLKNLDMSDIPSAVSPSESKNQFPQREKNDSIPWDDVSPSESTGNEDDDIRDFFGKLSS